jgi:hypothetical protein
MEHEERQEITEANTPVIVAKTEAAIPLIEAACDAVVTELVPGLTWRSMDGASMDGDDNPRESVSQEEMDLLAQMLRNLRMDLDIARCLGRRWIKLGGIVDGELSFVLTDLGDREGHGDVVDAMRGGDQED